LCSGGMSMAVGGGAVPAPWSGRTPASGSAAGPGAGALTGGAEALRPRPWGRPETSPARSGHSAPCGRRPAGGRGYRTPLRSSGSPLARDDHPKGQAGAPARPDQRNIWNARPRLQPHAETIPPTPLSPPVCTQRVPASGWRWQKGRRGKRHAA
jgi:hypothetical protein